MPKPGYRSNWIWLSDLKRLDRILLEGSEDKDLVRCIAAQFRDVVLIVRDRKSANVLFQTATIRDSGNVHVICATPCNLPLASDSFSGVVLRLQRYGARRRDHDTVLGRIACECSRVLEREGWLFVLWLQPRWHRGILWRIVLMRRGFGSSWRRLKEAPVVRSRPKPVIMGAGFRTIRPYYVIPSLTDPRKVVPMRRRALLAITVRFARRVLIRLGLHGLLFPARLLFFQK